MKRNAQSVRGTRTVPALCSCRIFLLCGNRWKYNKSTELLARKQRVGVTSRLEIAISVVARYILCLAASFCPLFSGAVPPYVFCVFTCHTHRHMDKRLWEQAIGDATYVSPLPLFSFPWTLFSMTKTSILHLIFSTPTTVPSLWSKESSGLYLTNK